MAKVTGEMSEPSTENRLYIDLMGDFKKAAAMPAPQRNLAMPEAGRLARTLFEKHSTVYFGETHDDTNIKFLADNPAFFKEAAAQGVRHVFVEWPVYQAPLFKQYFDGKISKGELESALSIGVKPTSGDSSEAYARQYANLCETAKKSGLVVHPSDFRSLPPLLSTDVFGIPDITGTNGEIQRQTKISLEKFRQETGRPYPATLPEIMDFTKRHLARIKTDVPPDVKDRMMKENQQQAGIVRKSPQDDPDFVKANDKLQFDYYSRLVEPGKKAIFFGGSDHFSLANTLDNHIRDNGYGAVAGVLLLSEPGAQFERAKMKDGSSVFAPVLSGGQTLNTGPKDQFLYTIFTEKGQIVPHGDAAQMNRADTKPAQGDPQQPALRKEPAPSFQPGMSPR